MAVIAHAFVEQITNQSTTSATLVAVPGVALPAASFTPGKQYLLVSTWQSAPVGANASVLFAVRHGSTDFAPGTLTIVAQGTFRQTHGWFTVWTAVADEAITLQFAIGTATSAHCNFASLLAINLSDNLAATDWAFAEVDTDVGLTTTPVNGAAVTVTPAAASDWLVLTRCVIDRGDSTTISSSRIARSGEAASTDPSTGFEQVATHTGDFPNARVYALGAASNTFTEQALTTSGTAHTRTHSRVFALNLSKFRNAAWSYAAAGLALGATDYVTELASVILTPAVASDVWIGAFWGFDRNGTARRGEFRLQANSGDVPDGQTTANYQFNAGTALGDEGPMLLSTLGLAAAATPIVLALDASADSITSAPAATYRTLWAITMELAAAEPVAYTLTADPGTYTVTGAAADLRVARRLTATPGSYTVTGAAADLTVAAAAGWVAVENFDSYSVGQNLHGLTGGTGWSDAWSDFGIAPWTIQTASAGGQGGRSVAISSVPAGGALIQRTLTTPVSAGLMQCRMRVAATAASGDTAFCSLLTSGPDLKFLLNTSGTITAAEAVGTPTVGTWALNTWLQVVIEIDVPTNRYRIAFDAGAWSAWLVPTSGSIATVTRLQVGAGDAAALELDDIGPPSAVAAYTLTATPGSYAVTGVPATLQAARRLLATPETYAVTGAPAALRVTRRLSATPDLYALTGSSASLRGARTLATAPGSYADTGSPATLRAARRVTATPGVYGVTGSSAELRAARRVLATPGAYASTGVAAALRLARRLGATSGSYLLTGSDAVLTVSGAPVGFLLSATPGVYGIVGSPAILATARRVAAAPGISAVTGSPAALTRARVLVATPGLYTSTGSPAGLRVARRLGAASGLYAVTGSLATLVRGRRLVATPGLYAVAGSPALLRVAYELTAAPGLYLLIGSAATLTASTEGLPPPFAFVRFTAETLRGAGWVVETLETSRFTGETLRPTRFLHEVMEGSI